MAKTSCRVELGFVEESPPWRLKSEYFPSKIGGKPAWLSPCGLPTPSELSCKDCGDPCTFLLQVYAPRDEKPDTFHRTLFVFACKNSCCPGKERNTCVFRCQLPRSNAYYSFDPPPEVEEIALREEAPKSQQREELCVVCGCAGPKRCAKCRAASYCSKKHQLIHWKSMGHRYLCGTQNAFKRESTEEACLLREFELVTEPESLDHAAVEEPSTTEAEKWLERTEEERMKDYRDFLRSPAAQNIMRYAEQSDFEAMSMNRVDKIFSRFKKRTEREPTQVLRFHPGGDPLWVSGDHVLSPEDIPACPACNAPRTFEFQVMPQLLNHLGLDQLESCSLDFGTLAVFTCSQSCGTSSGNITYQPEFIWTQHFS